MDFYQHPKKAVCIVLYCIVLYCIVLYCVVLCCIVLYCNHCHCFLFCLYIKAVLHPGVRGAPGWNFSSGYCSLPLRQHYEGSLLGILPGPSCRYLEDVMKEKSPNRMQTSLYLQCWRSISWPYILSSSMHSSFPACFQYRSNAFCNSPCLQIKTGRLSHCS